MFEFEEGGSLADLAEEELLSIPILQRLEFAKQICDALAFAHENNLIHRDVKPDNILISTSQKHARLCDFGLVFIDDEGARVTRTIEQVGSRYFIPPELEDGIAEEVTTKSDIYSMGKVLYYLISGKMFAREIHREEKYDLVKLFENPYLEAINEILDESVCENPNDRMDSVAEMGEEIQAVGNKIKNHWPIAGIAETYHCVFCKEGQYEVVGVTGTANLGYCSEGSVNKEEFVFLECDNCGNSQRFKIKIGGKRWFNKEYQEWLSKHRY